MKYRVIVAAGHGDGDPGAMGQGTSEAAECIQIVNRLAEKIRADGRFEVVVVPHELGLVGAINWVNANYKNTEDGVAIEVHKNSTVNAHGVEVWYWGNDNNSRDIAQKVLDGIMRVPGMPQSRGVKGDNTNRWGSLGWIRETNPWAILAEMGFVSDGGDPVDDAADNRYAEGLYQGFLNLFGMGPKVTPVPAPTPAPVKINFRVYDNTKQIGAYNTESGAWNKYADPVSQAVKILDSTGKDVTAQFVLKYRPIVPPPVDPSPSHPEYDPAKDKEQDEKINALQANLAALKAVVDGIIAWIKSFGGNK